MNPHRHVSLAERNERRAAQIGVVKAPIAESHFARVWARRHAPDEVFVTKDNVTILISPRGSVRSLIRVIRSERRRAAQDARA